MAALQHFQKFVNRDLANKHVVAFELARLFGVVNMTSWYIRFGKFPAASWVRNNINVRVVHIGISTCSRFKLNQLFWAVV